MVIFMDNDNELTIKLNEFEAVITATVKPHGNGSHVTVPKKYLGKKVKVVILKE